MPKKFLQPTLNDEDADYVIEAILRALPDVVPPGRFHLDTGRGIDFKVLDSDRTRARNLVRLFVQPALPADKE